MTKTNKALLLKIQTGNTELETPLTVDQLQFITDMLETAATAGSVHPNIFKDEIEHKWCIRHENYEPLTEWTIPNSGKLDASCDVAVTQWKEFTKIVKKAEKAMMENIDNSKAAELMTKWQIAKNIRSGKYTYPTEKVETEVKEKEVQTPKKRTPKKSK